MPKKKAFFITFEGIEGSGKSFQSKKLYRNLKKKGFKAIITREPGGTINAERIRKLILEDYFKKKSTKQFHKITDTLLYLAARNEHIKNTIKPAINKKKIIICDRFIDSTIAYQVYGKRVNINLINVIHKNILDNIKPDLTFVMKCKISKAMKRLNKRKNKNRYDKFSKKFYSNVQKAFIKIANKNKGKYIIVNNSENEISAEKIIINKFLNKFNK
jgi:dTMP kinase